MSATADGDFRLPGSGELQFLLAEKECENIVISACVVWTNGLSMRLLNFIQLPQLLAAVNRNHLWNAGTTEEDPHSNKPVSYFRALKA